MTLVTHAFIGAAAASFVPQHPVLAFVAGFASHLAIDAIPHWSEAPAMLRSMHTHPDGHRDMRLGRDFFLDLAYLGTESLVGILLAVLLFAVWSGIPLAIVLIGSVAGLLPDALHFVYFKTRSILLRDFERFHAAIQHEQARPQYLFVEGALAVLATALVRYL
jgi:hypothetical protein